MDTSRQPSLVAAALLAAVALVHAVTAGSGSAARRWARTPPVLASADRAVIERCRENVEWIHDIEWAAACASNGEDDSPDCMLPNDRARLLNSARDAAEAQCFAEVRRARVAGIRRFAVQ